MTLFMDLLWPLYVFALNFFLYLPYPVTDSWLRPAHGDIRYSSDHLLALAQRGTTVGRALFELPFQCFLLHLHGTVADFHAPPRQPAHDGICSISEAAKTRAAGGAAGTRAVFEETPIRDAVSYAAKVALHLQAPAPQPAARREALSRVAHDMWMETWSCALLT